MAGGPGNGKELRKTAEGQFTCTGEVLSTILAHFQSERTKIVQVDIDLVRGIISGCRHKDVAQRCSGAGKFPAPALIAAAIESQRAFERGSYLLRKHIELLIIEWTACEGVRHHPIHQLAGTACHLF